jgi:signal peptidase I
VSEENEPKGNTLVEDLPTLALAVGAALLIRTFVFQSFYVPSESMYPTLLVGDHVFVNKFVYGAQIPFTDSLLPRLRDPKRGEVVVFDFARGPGGIYPADQRPELPQDAFVKRLIGLPGDRLAVRQGQVILNGEPVALEKTEHQFGDRDGRIFDVYVESLPGCRHFVLDDPRVPPKDMREITVKPGRYFFMGDNRDNSYDGRMVGTVRSEELAGPAGLLYWSWDWNGSWLALLNPLTWWENLTSRMRWDRMGPFRECLQDGESPAAGP